MVWFKASDTLHSEDRITRIPRAIRAEAMGTYILCGTWSAQHERDGFVPEHIIDEVAASYPGADALVEAKVWRRVRGGYRFARWAPEQPTRQDNTLKREAERKRQAEYRASRAGNSAYVTDGQKRNTPLPSRPVPNDDVKQVPARPNVSDGSAVDDLSTGSSPVVDAVIRAAARHCNRELHPLVVHDVVAFIDSRRGPNAKPLQVPARYYGSAIARSAFEVQQFIDEKGLTA